MHIVLSYRKPSGRHLTQNRGCCKRLSQATTITKETVNIQKVCCYRNSLFLIFLTRNRFVFCLFVCVCVCVENCRSLLHQGMWNPDTAATGPERTQSLCGHRPKRERRQRRRRRRARTRRHDRCVRSRTTETLPWPWC